MQAGIESAALASAAVGVTNVVGTVVAASLMDRAGRKQLLALSFSGMGLSMLVMAAGLGIPSLAPYAGPVALVLPLLWGDPTHRRKTRLMATSHVQAPHVLCLVMAARLSPFPSRCNGWPTCWLSANTGVRMWSGALLPWACCSPASSPHASGTFWR